MYESILVPLDGSKAAEMVLPYIVEIGSKLSNDIILFGVSEHSKNEELYYSYLKSIVGQVQTQLNDYMPNREIKVFSEVLFGEPATQILNNVYKRNISLIAMTSRGSSGQAPWLLGNIAAKVIRATSVPVMLIRSQASEIAIKNKRIVKKIMVPLDGSKLAEKTIPFAEALSKALNAELVFFRVLELIPDWIGSEAPVLVGDSLEKRREYAIDYLESIGTPLKDNGVNVSYSVAIGLPADRIIEHTKENNIDLIAMSSHGRTGIGRWVLGSVTDKVLHAGDMPVLGVRPTKAMS